MENTTVTPEVGALPTVTRSIVGPESKTYSAVFAQAPDMSRVSEVIADMGLTLAEVNEALRKAKVKLYVAALESTVDSKVEKLYAALIDGGYDKSEARVIADAKRATLGSGLPKGVTQVFNADGTPKISLRGRKSDDEKEG